MSLDMQAVLSRLADLRGAPATPPFPPERATKTVSRDPETLKAQAAHLDTVLAKGDIRPRLRFPGRGEFWLLRDSDPKPGDGAPAFTVSEWLELWAGGTPHPALVADVLAVKGVFGGRLERVQGAA